MSNGRRKGEKRRRQKLPPSRSIVALQLLENRPWSVGCGWKLDTETATALFLNELTYRELAVKSRDERNRALYKITDKGRRILRLLKQRAAA